MTGDWVEYNDENLHDLYSSPKKYQGDKNEENKMIRAWGTCRGEKKSLQSSSGER